MAAEDWVARASRVLVSASRRNNLFREVRDGEDAIGPSRTGGRTRDARATRRFPNERSIQNLARRRKERWVSRIQRRNIRGHGGARRCSRHSADASERPRLSLEL